MEKQCDKCMYTNVCRFKETYLNYVRIAETSVAEYEANMDEEKRKDAEVIDAKICIYCSLYRKDSVTIR